MQTSNSPKNKAVVVEQDQLNPTFPKLRSEAPSTSESHVSGSTLNLAPSSVKGSTGTATGVEIDRASIIPRKLIDRARPRRFIGGIAPRAKGNHRYLI